MTKARRWALSVVVLGYPHVIEAQPNPDDDFAARCSDPNVVRCYAFDDSADLAPRMYDPSGGPGLCTNNRCWQVDTVNKASGAGSLRFEIPSNSPADTSGSFWINFRDDLSAQFGGNESFFIQWRQRFSPEFITTHYAGGGGWKQTIIGTGDQPGSRRGSCVIHALRNESLVAKRMLLLGPHVVCTPVRTSQFPWQKSRHDFGG